MIVIAMIGILAAGAFYMWGPYLNRSRDVSRFTDLQQYSRVLDLYFKDHETIPSNYTWAVLWLCADEVFFERESIAGKENRFGELKQLMWSSPLRDPVKSNPPISWCTRSGSYLYSKVDSISGKLYSVLGTRMSIRSNWNYLTGNDISPVTGQANQINIDKMQASYKWTISDTTEWSMYYYVATQH